MRGLIADVVADVLNEHDVDAARALLAEAVLGDTDTEMATRVTVRRDRPDALLRIHGQGFRPAAEELPSASDVRAHPLYRYRAETGDLRPTRLADAVRRGWTVDDATRAKFDALRISAHQVDFIASTCAEYEGWTLIAPSPLSRAQVRPLVEHAALLRGLDGHIELLARVRARLSAALPATCPLTPRELTILHLMCSSRTASSMGAQLRVSARTVHKHQEHIYRKLRVTDRVSAVLVGQRMGLLPAPLAGEEAAAPRDVGPPLAR